MAAAYKCDICEAYMTSYVAVKMWNDMFANNTLFYSQICMDCYNAIMKTIGGLKNPESPATGAAEDGTTWGLGK